MAKKSAGILLYRFTNKKFEIFLVHPGGPYWKNKDTGVWTIPKGEFDDKESAIDAAKREMEEETGIKLDGDFFELTPVKQKSGKWVYAFAKEYDLDISLIKSNEFEMEWPPKSGVKKMFPEIDKAGWFDIRTAKEKIIAAQWGLVEELINRLQIT
jgi:predicted NUDIX family NTP pyrophosphohydrolase